MDITLPSLYVALILVIWLMIRNKLVHSFYIRLITEEYDFMVSHASYMVENNVEWLRRNSLPSYNKMLLSIWMPLRKYEKPLSDFYKLGRIVKRSA